MRRLVSQFMVLASVLAQCACAQQAVTPEPPGQLPQLPVTTRHSGLFNGQHVEYEAVVSAVDVNDAEGRPGARIVSFAYLADNAPDPSRRPVMFVFNGGPIAPSVYLHMGAFGPKRVVFPADLSAEVSSAPTLDNPDSILDVCDLVYFDPAGTGFSRVADGVAEDSYFSVDADAQQTAAFIAGWLEQNGRLESPTYIFGESYGTNRAAVTAGQLAALDPPVLLDGVVLFGQAVNIIEYAQRPQNIISYAVSLPTLAAIGWYHGKADRAGLDLDAFIAAAADYAQDEYLEVLYKGNSASPEEVAAVAGRLEQITGLRAGYFVEKNLRVSKEEYRVELFRDEGLLIGRSDGRYVAAMTGEETPPDPAASIAEALKNAFAVYLAGELGISDAGQYITTSPVAGLNDWGWGGTTPFSRFAYGESISSLYEKYPAARVLVGTGIFDTMTTIGAADYLVRQEDWPRDRVMLETYYGGHMAYSDESSNKKLARDLRALIQASQ